MSVPFTKVYSFSTDLTNGKHDFSSHAYFIMMSNVAPSLSWTAKANVTECAQQNGYLTGGLQTTITKSNASGVETLVGTSVVWTGTGGALPLMRYAWLYNNTQTTQAKPLVGYWDYGSSVAPALGQTFSVVIDGVAGFEAVG